MNASEKRAIVVTGGAGSFGPVLGPYLLARGIDVHAVDRRHRPACPPIRRRALTRVGGWQSAACRLIRHLKDS